MYFTTDKDYAGMYAGELSSAKKNDTPRIVPAYLNLKNPFVIHTDVKRQNELKDKLFRLNGLSPEEISRINKNDDFGWNISYPFDGNNQNRTLYKSIAI